MNKVEQVSNDGHQMSLASGVHEVPSWGGGLYSEFQCIMGNGHMGTPRVQTDMTENITFPQLRWPVVKIFR